MGEQKSSRLSMQFISKAVAEDRGLPLLLVTSLNLYAIPSLKEFVYRFASNRSTGKKNHMESYRTFLVSTIEAKQGESFSDVYQRMVQYNKIK